ncbi:4-(cytidine 5'-diphospho)-2-C-methyl-D-erythritol kinase [Candidatus Omnitrophota bacterium]
MRSLILKSPAKLNLYLNVIGKRRDGYHSLYSLFERIDLCDEITLTARTDSAIKISSTSSQIPSNSSNLAYTAAQLLKETLKICSGVSIRIKKRIPVAAGLGGGSSNAASVLLGLNRLWRLGLTKKDFLRFSQQIGSDVPFFVCGNRFSIATGRGEKLKNVTSMKSLWHIVVVPRRKVSTKVVYKALRWNKTKSGASSCAKMTTYTNLLTKSRDNANMLIHALDRHNLPMAQRYVFNALEKPAVRLCPSISMIKRTLSSLGVEVCALSGSGPAVFGIVNSRKEAMRICRAVKAKQKQWQVFGVRTY